MNNIDEKPHNVVPRKNIELGNYIKNIKKTGVRQ